MDIDKVKQLIEMLDGSELAEIEIHEGDDSIRISRYSQLAPQVVASAPVAYAENTVSPVPAAADEAATAAAIPDGHIITAPIIGTFYLAPSPGAKPFVSVGQRVNVGDTLCIVEAMKILNQIDSDKAGVVTAILVENGQPVEYGEPMFAIE
ncbi:MAG: acetyl-CoA carboxylase biotin carboxyl carrier protein [Gammaproteobacteria bacterium]|nr:acetyl-CoA carboxylase biotin carboxyl carrier protein [Gammaproteobacteria bacterium]